METSSFLSFFSLNHFLVRAGVAGIGLALLAGPVGCFLVWRRMAYFGDTLAHSALLGVSLSLLFQLPMTASVFTVALALSFLLLFLQTRAVFSSDALLGLLSHSALAFGLLCLTLINWVQIDLMAFLFGDILTVSHKDLLIIYGGGILASGILILIWRRLFALTVNRELAEAEGISPFWMNLVFVTVTSGVIAIAMKIVGILLITALMIIPAVTARRFTASPEGMAFLASVIGAFSVGAGLLASVIWDTPSGPSIVASATFFFAFSLIFLRERVRS